MRKNIGIAVLLCMLGALGYFGWMLYQGFLPEKTPVPDRQSRIEITTHSGSYEVINPEERELLLRIFGQSYVAEYDTPSCPFDYVTISFIYQGRSIEFFPAADGCNLVRYREGTGVGGKVFGIDNNDTRDLVRLWKKAYREE